MSGQRNETQQADGTRPSVRQRAPYYPKRGRAPPHRPRTIHRRSGRCRPGCTPRSCATTVAHAVIRKVDTASATKMPGVIAAITGRDLAADDIGDIPPVASFNGRDGKPMFQAAMPVLAAERVRYVGEAGRRRDRGDGGSGARRRRSGRGRARSAVRCAGRGARNGEGRARRSGGTRRAISRSTGRTAMWRRSMLRSRALHMSSGCG